MSLDKAVVYELTDAIAAVEDAYYQLTTQTDFDDEDAEFLLKFRYPLFILAEIWATHLEKHSADFDVVLNEFYDYESLKRYPLAATAEKTYQNKRSVATDAAITELLGAVESATGTIVAAMADTLGISVDE